MQTEEAINGNSANGKNDEVILQIAVPLTRAIRMQCKVKAAQMDTSITAQVREFLERWANEPAA